MTMSAKRDTAGRERRPAKVVHHRPLGDVLRLVPLGGLEEIGRNMMYLEYKNEIIIVDMGLQFPEENTPGIDYIIPNITSLIPKKDSIKAVVLTHAHYDHIGAIPYLMGKLGNPPIYATALTKELILKRHEEFVNAPKLNVEVVKGGDKTRLSNYFEAEFFSVVHNIPDTIGVAFNTPEGRVVHCAEFKISRDEKGKPVGLDEFERIAKGGVDVLLLDSTNAEEPGFSVSEKMVEKNIDDIFKKAQGRIVVGLFASLLNRIGEIMRISEKYGRKIALSGSSMKTNVQIAINLGYIKVSKGTIIPLEDIHKHPDNKIVVLATGAQGESNASMMKIVNGEHRYVQIKKGDTIVFSASIIPGNERQVQYLKDNLARQGAVVYHSRLVDVHSSGHAPQEELKTVIGCLKPKYFIPIHGYYFLRASNGKLAEDEGVSAKNVVLADNGQVIEISKGAAHVTEETVPAYYVMVDGLGVGDVGEVVMRDRLVLAEEGMVVIIATIDKRTGRFLKNPDIISRGFIYLRENKEIVEEMRKKMKAILGRIPRKQSLDSDYVKGLVRDQIGQFVYNKTKRRPMILPVIIEI